MTDETYIPIKEEIYTWLCRIDPKYKTTRPSDIPELKQLSIIIEKLLLRLAKLAGKNGVFLEGVGGSRLYETIQDLIRKEIKY